MAMNAATDASGMVTNPMVSHFRDDDESDGDESDASGMSTTGPDGEPKSGTTTPAATNQRSKLALGVGFVVLGLIRRYSFLGYPPILTYNTYYLQ